MNETASVGKARRGELVEILSQVGTSHGNQISDDFRRHCLMVAGVKRQISLMAWDGRYISC